MTLGLVEERTGAFGPQAEFVSIMINRGDILINLAREGNTEMITRLVEVYGADVNHVHSKDLVRSVG